MISQINAWRERRRERLNRAAVSRCGPGTKLGGMVDRRAAGAVVEIGSDCLLTGLLVVERNESRLKIGDRVGIGSGTIIDCAQEIVIEDDVIFSYQCIVSDSDNHSLFPELRVNDVLGWKNGRQHDWTHAAMAPVRIGRGAWIGARAMIVKGVTIGEGAVIGMGSVVTRDVPPRTAAAGNPARVIREIGQLPAEFAEAAARLRATAEANTG